METWRRDQALAEQPEGQRSRRGSPVLTSVWATGEGSRQGSVGRAALEDAAASAGVLPEPHDCPGAARRAQLGGDKRGDGGRAGVAGERRAECLRERLRARGEAPAVVCTGG